MPINADWHAIFFGYCGDYNRNVLIFYTWQSAQLWYENVPGAPFKGLSHPDDQVCATVNNVPPLPFVSCSHCQPRIKQLPITHRTQADVLRIFF